MRKLLPVSLLCASLCVIPLFANPYQPPAGGQLVYQLTTPDALCDGASVAGGAFQSGSVEHLAINPARIALEQRVGIDLAVTAPWGPGAAGEVAFGIGAFAGVVVPTKYGVIGGSFQWLPGEFQAFALGNSFTLRAGMAKDVSDRLNVGADLYTSIRVAPSFDWAVGVDIGFTDLVGTWKALPFVTDFRWGASITGLGKNMSAQKGVYSAYPGIGTPRVGAAGTIFSASKAKGAVSVDLALPSFLDVQFNSAFHLSIADFLSVKTGWSFDLQDTLAKTASYLPYISLSVSFGYRAKDSSFLTEKGWQQSDVCASAAWRSIPGSMNVVSAGLSANLGLKDTAAPEITIWED